MNKLLKSVMLFTVLLSVFSCSVESIENDTILNETTELTAQPAVAQACSNNDPQSRLTNNGTAPLTFTVYSNNFANVATQSNIMPGASSSWISFVAGETLFSIGSDVSGVSDSKIVLVMGTCTEVDIVIDGSNTVASATVSAVN